MKPLRGGAEYKGIMLGVDSSDKVKVVSVASDGAINAYKQDQHSPIVNCYIGVLIDEPSLTQQANYDENTVVIDNTSLVLDDNEYYLSLQYSFRTFQAKITAISEGTLTIDTPLDTNFPIDGTVVKIRNTNLATIDGSTTPQIAYISPEAGQIWDITKITVNIEASSESGDSNFGGIDALANGLVFRMTYLDDDGNWAHYTGYNIKRNGNFRERGCEISYPEKVPSETYATAITGSFNGDENHGVVVRLDASRQARAEVLIQDALTDLTTLRIAFLGHVTDESLG